MSLLTHNMFFKPSLPFKNHQWQQCCSHKLGGQLCAMQNRATREALMLTNLLTDAVLVVYIKMRTVFRNAIYVVVFAICEQFKVHFLSAIKLMELLLNPWSC